MPSDARGGRGASLGALVDEVERLGGTLRLGDPSGDRAGLIVEAVTHDSRAVQPGSVFACLRGDRFDGHGFAASAVAAGAAALLVDHELPAVAVGSTPQLVVDDTRRWLGPIAASVYGHPSERLVTVGITGTNGKTTTAHLLGAVFEEHGWSCAVVGTLSGPRTTPEAPELQSMLAGFVDQGREAVVLEVSSHALALHRVDGTRFDAVVFTNLGRDHLDLHGSPEEYFRAKASLFSPTFSPLGIVNVDDPYGRLLADSTQADRSTFRVVPFSTDQIDDVELRVDGHRFYRQGTRFDVPIGGEFNVVNSLAALTTADALGVPAAEIAAGLRRARPIPGRFELVAEPTEERPFSVVVDYAHTPDGLAELLTSARQVVEPGGAVNVVFGCGGERDSVKRPEMGAVAARLADRVVVTSDNPRAEDPGAIIDEILRGVDNGYRSRVSSNPDRRAAIATALRAAGPGDIVVVAGKGHETTQDLGDRVVEFDDRAVALELLEETP